MNKLRRRKLKLIIQSGFISTAKGSKYRLPSRGSSERFMTQIAEIESDKKRLRRLKALTECSMVQGTLLGPIKGLSLEDYLIEKYI